LGGRRLTALENRATMNAFRLHIPWRTSGVLPDKTIAPACE
jgi:hypothetical protein